METGERDYYVGPLRFMHSADGVTWYLSTVSYMDSSLTDTNAANVALYAPSLQRNQSMIVHWVGVEEGHQFEVEMVRHYEGTVTEEFQSLPR